MQLDKKPFLESTLGLILLLIIFFPVGLLLMWFKGSWSKPVKWAVTAFFALVVIIDISASTHSKALQVNSQITSTPTKAPTSSPTPTIPEVAGINITRDAVIHGLQKVDPSIDFKLSTPVNGQERYMAMKGQNDIELYGSADNLVEVNSLALLGTTTGDIAGNTSALIYVLGVANAVDSKSTVWVTSTMKEISTAWSGGQNSVKQSTVIDGKKFDISAMKSDVFDTVSLSIYSSQEKEPPTTTKSSPRKSNLPKLNSTVKATNQYLVVTNNETAEWDNCDYSIGYDTNPNDFFELGGGLGGPYATIKPQQTMQIPWEQITKMDGTKFVHAGTTLPNDLYFFCSVNEKDKEWSNY